MKLIRYNFFKNWKKLQPHLQDIKVQRALIKGITRFCAWRNETISKATGEYPAWPGYGKCCDLQKNGRCSSHHYSYTQGTPLFYYSKFFENRFHKHSDPSKLSFYELWGSCHFIAHFVKALAETAYPKKKWKILKGETHTVVIDEPLTTVMDILNFKNITAEESLKWVETGISPKNQQKDNVPS
jgi:hypothetical protein